MFKKIFDFIKYLYPGEDPVPLHAPRFCGNEKKYLGECIDSSYVSYVGSFVTRFEKEIADFTGAKHAIATVSGTAALHLALLIADVRPGDEVITQPLTFVATANAISYCQAQPVFVDVEPETLGLDPEKLDDFLAKSCIVKEDGQCWHVATGRRISACVPMHTFGHPVRIDKIVEICNKFNITVIEDAAEALGSLFRCRHLGTFGKLGIFSFNGNKPVTTGGGGMIITDDDHFAERTRHLSTTAKIPHPFEFTHDYIGYNYRMPNINAAVGCAQIECLTRFLDNKRKTSQIYSDFFSDIGLPFFMEPPDALSNYWLNAIQFKDRSERDLFLIHAQKAGIQARPVWTLMNHLPMYRFSHYASLETAEWLEDRLVNIPSSVRW